MDMHSIYSEYYNRVLNYASARLPCRMDAEDICEDVFERVLTCLDAFDPDRASMSTWIFVITRNCVIDFSNQGYLVWLKPDNALAMTSIDLSLSRTATT